MIKNPEQFDVIVTNNMFGDIITDIGAIIQGGLGIAAGGNINPEVTSMFEPIGGSAPKYTGQNIFEPIGGSAPKYTGQNIINPLGAISAAQMMLDYLGEEEAAGVLLEAIKKVVKNDLESLEAGKMGYGTKEVGDLVVNYI
jgi:3-isopropylmalate dehydrogenase